jgi:hypothetical protein
MAKGLNKHTPDSDELLKRLNSNDSSGLDDFEKEALEGFDSLENIEHAKELTNSLNKRIDEVYFKEEKVGGNRKGFMYLSLAAGLVLIIGLSIFFTNIMGEKKEMAMSSDTLSTEKIANEVSVPTDLAPAPSAETKKDEGQVEISKNAEITTTDESKPGNGFVATGSGGKNMSAEQRAESQPDKDDGLKSRMVVKEPKTANKTSDTESGGDLKKQEADKLTMQGPPSGYVMSPNVAMDSKAKAQEEESKFDANEKTVSSKGNANAAPTTPSSSNSLAAKEPAKKSESKEKRKDQSNGESLGREDDSYVSTTTANTQKSTGGVVSENNRDESGYKHNVEYSNTTYSKPQDYIKTEINKSEMLKTNVKAFKAELTIDENGKVKDVKFLTAFNPSCVACEKEMRKILINMPGWKASPSKKAVKETVSYIDQ